MGLDEPGPGRGVDHLRFSDSDHASGIDSSGLIPEPLGPRKRGHFSSAVFGLGVFVRGAAGARVMEVRDISGRALLAYRLLFWPSVRNPRGISPTVKMSRAKIGRSQNRVLCVV